MSAELVVPDGIEPEVAWRSWAVEKQLVVEDGEYTWPWLLQSHNEALWIPRKPLEAITNICDAYGLEPHDAPDARCQCGIYACATRQALCERIHAYPGWVFGEVYLWGRIVDHRQGFRAQYAYPKQLYYLAERGCSMAEWEKARALGELYGVPCEVRDYQEFVDGDERQRILALANSWTLTATTANSPYMIQQLATTAPQTAAAHLARWNAETARLEAAQRFRDEQVAKAHVFLWCFTPMLAVIVGMTLLYDWPWSSDIFFILVAGCIAAIIAEEG